MLGHTPVGRHDDFFALGGHSLLATQLISRIQAGFAIDMPLRAIFEHPTLAGLASQIAASQPPAAAEDLTITPVPRDQPLPLSYSQRRLWFLCEFEPDTSAYNMVNSVVFRGELDLAVLRRSLDALIARHESLRTLFAAPDGQPVQIIQPAGPAALQIVDLQALAPDQRLDAARQLVLAEAQRVFDLTRGPLFRAVVAQLDPQRHLLCLNVHHIVSDGWSEGIMFRELIAIYGALRAGHAPQLPALTIQYADYACWQQRRLQGAHLERLLSYWREQLGDANTPLNLPTDRPRPAIRTSAGAALPYAIDGTLLRGVQRLAGSASVSLFIVVLAALKALLYRYTNDSQISVGTYIANRQHQATEPLIGFFVNSLVLRSDLAGQPSFSALLRRVREVALNAYEHQEVPFEKLLEVLQPPRDMSHTPLFQVMLVLHNTPPGNGNLPDLAVEPFELAGGVHTQVDLLLQLTEQADQLAGVWEYNSDLFMPETIAQLARHLTNLLAAVVANPEQPIDLIDLLDADERAGLLQATSGPAADAISLPIEALLQHWAARQPDAPALIWQGQTISYGQLEHDANQLAQALRARGVGPEIPVAILVERSPVVVISVLAVLKAGGAYVALDPGQPAERLAALLADCRPQLVISQRQLRGLLPPGAATLCLDEQASTLASLPAHPPPAQAGPHNLAYIVYTSGSTGQPKGVMVECGSLANACAAWRDAYRLQPGCATSRWRDAPSMSSPAILRARLDRAARW